MTTTTTTANNKKIWYVDGVSCLGKTSFVHAANQHGLKLDYAERSKAVPFFCQKAQNHVVQILYTATFGLEVLQRAQRDHNAMLFVDRSPISDVWYELLFKHYDDLAYQDLVFDQIQQLDVFAMMPTVFVLPHPTHAPDICQQMRIRSNGLDHLSVDYVLRQIHIFERVIERFGEHRNVRVIRVGADQPIFTENYFAWMRDSLQTATAAAATTAAAETETNTPSSMM